MSSYPPTILLCLIACLQVAGQRIDPRVSSLLDAERDFARMAKEKNSRDAFLHFLTDDAVTASQGRGPRTGKDHLHKQPIDSALLSWDPIYSCVAASGDFGFNTGPWEFRKNKRDDEPIAWGQFVSIWERNTEGEWRVSLDMGIYHGKPGEKRKSPVTTLRLKKPRKRETFDIQDFERAFTGRLDRDGIAIYRSVMSSETRFLRPGREPLSGMRQIEEFLKIADDVRYEVMGGAVASSGDLAYAYGSAMIRKKEGADTSTHSYLRIWQKIDGQWRLALDLMTP